MPDYFLLILAGVCVLVIVVQGMVSEYRWNKFALLLAAKNQENVVELAKYIKSDSPVQVAQANQIDAMTEVQKDSVREHINRVAEERIHSIPQKLVLPDGREVERLF